MLLCIVTLEEVMESRGQARGRGSGESDDVKEQETHKSHLKTTKIFTRRKCCVRPLGLVKMCI
jgi:hypothetical protein